MARYEVIEITDEGCGGPARVVNVIEWDGVTPYDPGEGVTLRLCMPDPADIEAEDAAHTGSPAGD